MAAYRCDLGSSTDLVGAHEFAVSPVWTVMGVARPRGRVPHQGEKYHVRSSLLDHYKEVSRMRKEIPRDQIVSVVPHGAREYAITWDGKYALREGTIGFYRVQGRSVPREIRRELHKRFGNWFIGRLRGGDK